MFDEQLFEYIRCPVTKSPLSAASPELIDQVNAAIAAQTLVNRLNVKLQTPLEAGVVNADKTILYPAASGIPTLIADEAIDLSNIRGSAAEH